MVRHVFLSDKGGYLTAVRSGPARLSYWLGVDNRVTVDVDVKPIARYGHDHRFLFNFTLDYYNTT